MALSSRGRTSMYDENTLHAGKMPVTGLQGPKAGANGNPVLGKSTGGLKQQTTTTERRILSDISNTKAPSLSSFGTPKPSPKPGFVPFREIQPTKVDNVFKSENLPPKAGLPQSSSKAGARIPLRNIGNESVYAPASKNNGAEVVQQNPKPKSGAPKRLASKATERFRLTDEELRLADEWAKEDIHLERIHFTGDDMEALREKMIEAEIEKNVNLVRDYRVGPLPSPIIKSSEDNVEDSLRYADGRLKLDRGFEESDFSGVDKFDYFKWENDSHMEDPILIAVNNSMALEEDYPSIPENWNLREDCTASSV